MSNRLTHIPARVLARTETAFISITIAFLTSSSVMAGPPGDTAFTYQGQLRQGGDLANGVFPMHFYLYDAAAGGTVLADQAFAAVSVAEGHFTVDLDFGADVFNNSQRWLEIEVDGNLLSPRQPITRTPYALQTRGIFVDQNMRVGIGTPSPHFEATVHIQDNIGDNFGVLVDSFAVPGSRIGLHVGPSGYSSLAKNAYFAPGWTRFDDALGAAVQEIDPNGNVAFNVAPPGTGFIPWNTAIYIQNDGDVGIGWNAPVSRLGVVDFNKTAIRGESSLTAIIGRHFSDSGQASGVHGETESFDPFASGVRGEVLKANPGQFSAGVRGHNFGTNSNGFGVFGSHAGAGLGVYGTTGSGVGVRGLATGGSGVNIGVHGESFSPAGWAGFFSGKTHVAGNLLVGRQNTITAAEVFGVHSFGAGATFGGMYVSTADEAGQPFYGYAAGSTADAFHYIAGTTGKWHLNVAGTNRLTVQPNGAVGIGLDAPNFTLEVNGSAGKPGGGSWANSSDLRLKKSVYDLDGALDQLLALRGVTFEYINPEAINELPGVRIGMIAQEVEQVFPDWVENRPDGYKSLTYRGFEALTVEALRELRTENDELRARVETLERLVEQLLICNQEAKR